MHILLYVLQALANNAEHHEILGTNPLSVSWLVS